MTSLGRAVADVSGLQVYQQHAYGLRLPDNRLLFLYGTEGAFPSGVSALLTSLLREILTVSIYYRLGSISFLTSSLPRS